MNQISFVIAAAAVYRMIIRMQLLAIVLQRRHLLPVLAANAVFVLCQDL